jgi:anaerobic selenocysteine-containing dehydrogenase
MLFTMNRRSFVSRTLAAIAALPLLRTIMPTAKAAPVSTEWHPSQIPDCLAWDGISYAPDGSPIGEWIMSENMHGGGMFGRVLTEAEKRQIYDYLNKKYGFNL